VMNPDEALAGWTREEGAGHEPMMAPMYTGAGCKIPWISLWIRRIGVILESNKL
jgi:hypothetical protein